MANGECITFHFSSLLLLSRNHTFSHTHTTLHTYSHVCKSDSFLVSPLHYHNHYLSIQLIISKFDMKNATRNSRIKAVSKVKSNTSIDFHGRGYMDLGMTTRRLPNSLRDHVTFIERLWNPFYGDSCLFVFLSARRKSGVSSIIDIFGKTLESDSNFQISRCLKMSILLHVGCVWAINLFIKRRLVVDRVENYEMRFSTLSQWVCPSSLQ